ncbi:MAG: dockerin type I repeat-containing protein [Clostridia bacterium]|nr:dockerin type I repeat-containing protein [Clostridia bacterium]
MNRTMKRALSLILCLLMLATVAPLRFQANAAKALTAGDVTLDGKVGSDDARLALRNSVKLQQLTVSQLKCADANQDGKVGSDDARLILRASVKLERLKAVSPVKYYNKQLSADEMKKYQSKDYTLQFMVNYYTDVADHVILDDFYEIEFSAGGVDLTKSTAQYYVGIGFNDKNEPFYYFPDPDKLAQGLFNFKVLHFSPFGVAKLSDEKLVDVWCERAASQSVMRNISEEEITPGLRDMVNDALTRTGFGEKQYGGAIVRYILSHDTKGEIFTAIADGDEKALKAKVANLAGEYVIGKVFTGEDDGILNQSVGDHADMVRDGIKKGEYAEATLEVVKNIEKNMFPYVNYADKFAGLTVKLADIWANDTVNEEFENFKKMGGKGISQDDWDTLIVRMRGATNWLSQKGVKEKDIRAMFEKRMDNDARVKKETANMKKLVEAWKDNNLLSTQYWGRSNGFSNTPPLVERLNSLRRIRESLKEMLSINGVLKKGKSYKNLTDEDFLLDCVFNWVSYGPYGRDEFYKWLRREGLMMGDSGKVADYAWVLVETQIIQSDRIKFTDPGDYTLKYDYSTPGKHTKTLTDRSNNDYVSFLAACTTPPKTIRYGETVYFTISEKLNGCKGKDIDLTDTADLRRDQPGLSSYTSAGPNALTFASKNGKTSVKAESPTRQREYPTRSASLEVYHKFGDPDQEDAITTASGARRIALVFNGAGAQTVWIYEWHDLA